MRMVVFCRITDRRILCRVRLLRMGVRRPKNWLKTRAFVLRNVRLMPRVNDRKSGVIFFAALYVAVARARRDRAL